MPRFLRLDIAEASSRAQVKEGPLTAKKKEMMVKRLQALPRCVGRMEVAVAGDGEDCWNDLRFVFFGNFQFILKRDSYVQNIYIYYIHMFETF